MYESYTRYSAEENETIILAVKCSELSISKRSGVPRRTFIIGIRDMLQEA